MERYRRTCSLLLLAVACRPVATPRPPDGTSRITLHSSLAPPVGVAIRPAMALYGGRAGFVGNVLSPPRVQRVERFPHTLRCQLGTVCQIAVRNRLGALVFAFDPEVQVVVEAPADASTLAVPRYLDAGSTSAALGQVLQHNAALSASCDAGTDDRSAVLEAQLRDTAANETRAVVRDAAALALVDAQCTGAAENRRLARRLLQELDPSAPALQLWTDAVLELGVLADDPPAGDALIERIIGRHSNPEVGGRLLLRQLDEAVKATDARAIERLAARLREPKYSRTSAALFASMLGEQRDNLRVAAGDLVPAVELPLLSGRTLSTREASRGQPLLVYLSASWCGGCIAALPSVRRLAREHPELQIAYVLWDELDDANAFVQRHGPVPAAVSCAEGSTRAAILAKMVKHPVFPSFILSGPDGVVLATSRERDIDDLGALLSAPTD